MIIQIIILLLNVLTSPIAKSPVTAPVTSSSKRTTLGNCASSLCTPKLTKTQMLTAIAKGRMDPIAPEKRTESWVQNCPGGSCNPAGLPKRPGTSPDPGDSASGPGLTTTTPPTTTAQPPKTTKQTQTQSTTQTSSGGTTNQQQLAQTGRFGGTGWSVEDKKGLKNSYTVTPTGVTNAIAAALSNSASGAAYPGLFM